MTTSEHLRGLPAIGSLLEHDTGQTLISRYGHGRTVAALRATLDQTRSALLDGKTPPIDAHTLLNNTAHTLEQQTRPILRPVINATGVIIHTNLGRAPLCSSALDALISVGAGYSSLEFNLESGKRGSRNHPPEQLLTELTGAEGAVVVNNAASALVLILTAFAIEREVIVSRGQAVEIGGGFRIPDIMRQTGATLVEVGTTNKTRPADYANAITPNTAMLLRVHSSNFRQIGFTETASLSDMAKIAHQGGVMLVDDIGSGALLDTAQFGLTAEPLVQDSIRTGADLVLFSGDKLLGGPQAGIIVGRAEPIAKLKRHPLMRALRADKLILAALVATLAHYHKGDALAQIPVWWMMSRNLCDLGRIAKRWSKAFPGASTQKGESTVGGGSIPGSTLPTTLLALDVPQPDDFVYRLRQRDLPIIARIADNRVLFDPRTVFPEQEEVLLNAIEETLRA